MTDTRATWVLVVAAGAVVAVVDWMAAALLGFSVTGLFRPIRTLQGIAAGIYGRATFDGGLTTAAVGLLCHVAIAYAWTTAYFLIFQGWDALRRLARRPTGRALIAVVVGTVVWLGMNFVVVPLSHATPTPRFTLVWFELLAIHWVAVGFPIAVIVR